MVLSGRPFPPANNYDVITCFGCRTNEPISQNPRVGDAECTRNVGWAMK